MEGERFFMEYVRNIAYIYAYHNGFKNKNTGFARIELWGETLKIFVNMKCAYAQENGYWDVMLFYRQDAKIHGVKIGEIFLHGGIGEYHYVGFSGDLAGSGHSFSEMAGMYFCSASDRSRFFASEWDDRGFEPSRIVNSREEKPPYSDATVQDMPESAEKSGENAAEQPEAPVQEKETLTAAQVFDGYSDSRSDCRVAVFRPDGSVSIKERDGAVLQTAATYEAADTAVLPEADPALRFEGREKMILFSDDDLYDCIEITLDDLEKLPEESKGLKNNSFLNHAYFNFRHLILAKQRGNNGTFHYIIGIPGLFTNRERNTAAMFGFEHFKFSMRGDIHLNQFGYWYKRLDGQ